MMRLALTALACSALLADASQAQDRDLVDRNRERWEQKDPQERELLKSRFDQLKKLSDEERAALEGLARKIKDKKRKARESLPEDVRRRMEDLPPHEREGIFHDHFRDTLRQKGSGVRRLLPEGALDEIEREAPSRRALRLDRLLRDHRPITPHDVKRLGKELGINARDLRELDSLAPGELEERALAWNRERIDRCVAEYGLPPGLGDAEYTQMRDLTHAEFFQRWRELDPPPPYSDAKKRRRDRVTKLTEKGRELLERLRQAHRLAEPTFEERFEHAELSEPERREAMGAVVRRRVIAYLETNGLVSVEDLKALRDTKDAHFMSVAHRLFNRIEHDLLGEGGRPSGAHERPPGLPGPEGRRPRGGEHRPPPGPGEREPGDRRRERDGRD